MGADSPGCCHPPGLHPSSPRHSCTSDRGGCCHLHAAPMGAGDSSHGTRAGSCSPSGNCPSSTTTHLEHAAAREEVCCSRRSTALLKRLCGKLVVKEKKKYMFYYPPNSCCFILWGSFSEEVWPTEQRHKAQVLAGSRLLAPPSSAPPVPHPPRSTRLCTQGRAATAGHGPGKCTCCFMIFISRAIVGAVSRLPWGGGAGALLNGCWRGAASCGTQRAGCEARWCVSGSGGQGRGVGAWAGSHHIPWERKLGHSTASLSQRKPSARGGGIAGAQSHGAGLQDSDASPPGQGPGLLQPPALHGARPVPPPESWLWGWRSLGVARGWGPRGGVSIERDRQLWGHVSPCPWCSPSSFSITCAPFAHASGNHAGTAWVVLGHSLCQRWGGGRGRLCRLPRRHTAAGPRAPGDSSPL